MQGISGVKNTSRAPSSDTMDEELEAVKKPVTGIDSVAGEKVEQVLMTGG
jgi:hypothetical protein